MRGGTESAAASAAAWGVGEEQRISQGLERLIVTAGSHKEQLWALNWHPKGSISLLGFGSHKTACVARPFTC